MTTVALTLWDFGQTWDTPTIRAALDRVHAPIVQLHVDPRRLARDGDKLGDGIVAAYPGTRIWWGIPGDGYGPDPSRVWQDCYAAAIAGGIDAWMLDAEGAWKTRANAQTIAAHCMAVLAGQYAGALAANMHPPTLLHTSYDGPYAVPYTGADGKRRYWGGHSDYFARAGKAFLGADSPILASAWQVYSAGAHGQQPRATLPRREALSVRSRELAARAGWIRHDIAGSRRIIYLQAYGVHVADTIRVAEAYETACFWTVPRRIDEHGLLAMEALARLARLGQTLVEFQRAHGLKPDNVAAPEHGRSTTLSALLGREVTV